MTIASAHNVIVSDDIITDYAAGKLSPAKHIMVACHSEIVDSVAEEVAFQEDIAACVVAEMEPLILSPSFMKNVLASLPPQKSANENERHGATKDKPVEDITPKSLRHLLGHGVDDLKWKFLVPSLAVHDLLGERKKGGDRLYLIKVKSGGSIPDHSHNGEEWSLILKGSYSVGEKHFKRGDFYIEDETEIHSPQVEGDEDCICLLMTQAPLKMQGLIPKLIQPILGI